MKLICSVLILYTLIIVAGCSNSDSGSSPVNPATELTLTCDSSLLPYGGGSGTQSSPYLICSSAQFDNIRDNPSKHYRLDSDIVLSSSNWSGSILNFGGNFNGNGKIITGYTFSSTGGTTSAIFNSVYGTVYNVTLNNFNVTSDLGVAILVYGLSSSGIIRDVNVTGASTGSSTTVGCVVGINSGTIENVTANCTVTAINNGTYVGGIAAYNYGSIINSSFTGSVAGFNEVGGLVGFMYGGSIEGCSSSASVTGSYRVGGLVGDASNNATILESSSSGTVFVGTGGRSGGGLVGYLTDSSITSSYSSSNVSGHSFIGGLVGDNNTGSTISKSWASGSISVSTSWVGGFVGKNDGTINKSYSTGNVLGTEHSSGGFSGINNGSISDSFTSGSVQSPGDYIGGFTGSNRGSIRNSLSVGIVTASGSPSNLGGFSGANNDPGDGSNEILSSYWDTSSSGQSTSNGGTGLSTSTLKNGGGGSYAGWDFILIWNTPVGAYPTLR